MNEIHSRSIPFALVSAYFQEGHSLLKFPASLLGRRLSQFDRIFTQDAATQRRLELFGLNNAVISGDTRVDRVLSNANKVIEIPEVEQFINGRQVMVIGSNWPQDDELLFDCMDSFPDLRFIVAPHELSKKQEGNWLKRFKGEIILWDDLIAGKGTTSSKILYVNKVGLLSKLYRYADVVYVGGGFGVAVHNTLEAAVYKVPVICGPKNERFLEIQALKALHVVHEIADAQQLKAVMSELLENAELRSQIRQRADEYFTSQSGATSRIIDWLTNEK